MINDLKVKNTSKLVKLTQRLRKINAMIIAALTELDNLHKVEKKDNESFYYPQRDINEKIRVLLNRRYSDRQLIFGLLIVDTFGDELAEQLLSNDKDLVVLGVPRTFKFYEDTYHYLKDIK